MNRLVQLSKDDGIAIITIDNPPVNALSPGVPEAIRLLNNLGFAVVVVSNQPGVAKRHFDRSLIDQIEHRLRRALAPNGARIDATYYCRRWFDRHRSRIQSRMPNNLHRAMEGGIF